MNVRLAKRLDLLLGRPLASLLPSPPTGSIPVAACSILFIRPGGIGDAVLLASVIIKLRTSYPDATITVLAERRNVGVFELVPFVDHLFCYDRPNELLLALRGNYDVVIDSEQWHRLSAVIARLIRAPMKIGFATNERCRLFTHTVGYSHDDYEIDSFNQLLELLLDATNMETAVPFLTVPEYVRTRAAQLLGSRVDRMLITLFPGASIPERRWGVIRFRQVAEALVRQGYSVVVVGGGEDKLAGEQIAASGGLNLAGCTSLAETAAVLERSQLLISGDSGILHIAVGLDLPTVSLFGPGRARKWAPRGDKHIVINKNLSCSPCTAFGTTPPCPYNVRCMHEISVDDVIEAALTLLKKSRATNS